MAATKTPKLDEFIRHVVPSASKNADKELAKIQTFVLDAIAPLATILEAGNSEDKELSVEEVLAATTLAVELIGNASARISRLRREKVCSHLNSSHARARTSGILLALCNGRKLVAIERFLSKTNRLPSFMSN